MVGRRLDWTSLPILGVIGVGGWLLFNRSYALGDVVPLRISGIAIVSAAVALALWVVGRRMKDTSRAWILWLVGISVGGRLAEAGVRRVGGSWEQGQEALGLVIVLVLIGLGLVPSWRPAVPEPDDEEETDDDAEEAGVSP